MKKSLTSKNPDYGLRSTVYSQRGFTIIELVVVLGITVVLASVTVASFREVRFSQQLRLTGDDIISDIRDAQNAVLSGRVVQPAGVPVKAYDLVFAAADAGRYRVDYIFAASTTTNAETVNLPPRVRINRILVNGSPVGNLRLKVESPFGRISVGELTNRELRLELRHTVTGRLRTVIVDGISGRIGAE